jgi:hypothetical protein
MIMATQAQIQGKLRPKFVDMAAANMKGENLSNLLGFVDFLNENKIAVRYYALNAWKAVYKNKHRLCGLRLSTVSYGKVNEADNDSWSIGMECDMGLVKELASADEGVREIVWRNVKECYNCHPHCDFEKMRSKKRMILGKEFVGACNSWFSMRNPGKDDMELAKRIVMILKAKIDNK